MIFDCTLLRDVTGQELNWVQCLQLCLGLAQAGYSAEQRGFSLNDFKPENALLESTPQGLRSLVIDFGLGMRFDAGTTAVQPCLRRRRQPGVPLAGDAAARLERAAAGRLVCVRLGRGGHQRRPGEFCGDMNTDGVFLMETECAPFC